MRNVNINRRYVRKKQNIFVSHIQNNLKEYIIACLVFFIGVLLGIFFLNHLNDVQTDEITSYITNSIKVLKNDNVLNTFEMLKENIKQDIFITVILWLMGSTVIGLLLVYLIVCFKGFCLGYTISSIIYVLRNW